MISILSSDSKNDQLWKRVNKDNVVSKDAFKQAAREAKKDDRHIIEVLADQHASHHDKLLPAFSDIFALPAIKLRRRMIAPYVIKLIPKEVAEQHSVVIFKKIKNDIYVAVTNPDNHQIIEFIKKKTGMSPKIFITTPTDISHALKHYHSEISTEFSQIIKDSTEKALAVHDTAEKMAQFVPIIRIVNTIIERAIAQKASDIHFEPNSHVIHIRFRVDGLLSKIVELPKEILPPLVTRLKIMGRLKIDEHRAPQDGRFTFRFNQNEIAVRISIIPTLNGSKAVLRLLDTREQQFSLAGLGFNQRDLKIVKKEIEKPHGMILVTGPTGSGKTTTLYSLLRMLNKDHVNISTIEDPIEYGLEGVNQMQINPIAGLTFASGLRSLLRQDPNILMVGEIRDTETADMALNSAMTGHLVLSTLHTNSAFLAIQRLIEMGIQPFLATSVTNLIIGQRLVRKICTHCKSVFRSSEKATSLYESIFNFPEIFKKFRKLNLVSKNASHIDGTYSYGRGCDKCNGTGFRGRIGIYEVMSIDPDISSEIMKNPVSENIQRLAQKRGTLTINEDGILKVFNGQTTFAEVMRVTKE
ncbi:GspE/PulE family protein [Patescibacteria group bacterium]